MMRDCIVHGGAMIKNLDLERAILFLDLELFSWLGMHSGMPCLSCN